jgi:hypothetical protein
MREVLGKLKDSKYRKRNMNTLIEKFKYNGTKIERRKINRDNRREINNGTWY